MDMAFRSSIRRGEKMERYPVEGGWGVASKDPCWPKHPGSSIGHSREMLTAYKCRRLNKSLSLGHAVGEDARRTTEGFWRG